MSEKAEIESLMEYISDIWKDRDIDEDDKMHTGKGGVIIYKEVLLGRSLTKEEKNNICDGVYEISINGVKKVNYP